MGSGGAVIKAINWLLTVFFLIASIAFIIFGSFYIFITLKISSEDIYLKQFTGLTPALMIVFGILLLVFTILGGCSICRESSCCIETYSIFLVILAVAQIGLGVFCFVRFNVKDNKLRSIVEADIQKMFDQYKQLPGPMDSLQETLECCGVNQTSDWLNHKLPVPESCCPDDVEDRCTWYNPNKYWEGCKELAYTLILSTNYYFGLCLMVVGGIEYSAFLIVLAIAQIALGIVCLQYFTVDNEPLMEAIVSDVENMYHQYDSRPTPMDNLQDYGTCCGLSEGGRDWELRGRSTPASCCEDGDVEYDAGNYQFSISCNSKNENHYKDGCKESALLIILFEHELAGIILLSVAGVEILGAAFGIILSCCNWRQRRHY